MKLITTTLCTLLVLSLATGAIAQKPAPAAAPAPQAQPTPSAPPTFGAVINSQISIIEKEFVDAAEAMPEEKYGFTPVSLNIQSSDYKGVRTFAEEVKHVATANYGFWGTITGDP